MNRSLINKAFPQVLMGIVLVAAGPALALAQRAPAPGQRTDGQIEMDVVKALDASQALKNDLITAATIQSEVTLAGTVSDEASKELAASIVSGVPGVTGVHNNLKIGNPQDAQADGLGPAPANAPDDGSAAPPSPNNQAESDQGPMPPPQAYPQQPQQAPYPDGQQAPYPNQGQAQGSYPPPYPQARPQYAPPQQQGYNAPPEPRYETPTGPVTIPSGTLIQLRTNEPVASKHAKDGEPVQFTVINDVPVGGVLAIPRGATVHGVVTEVKHSGQVSGSPELALTLTSLDLGGQSYPLSTNLFKVKGPSKTDRTVGNAIGGGLLGTIIGCAVGRGAGCAIGAGAGVAGGVAASAATPGPGVWIPAEALVDFHLAAPLTVQPVSAQEAARLAQGLYQGGPSLYRRGPYGSPYAYGRPYPAPYPYYAAYPPVYYRPYYMTGGFYYWR